MTTTGDHDPEVVTPDQFAKRIAANHERMVRRCGLLAILDDSGRSVAKGTVFFVKLRGQAFFVTAKHVVRSDQFQQRGGHVLILRRDATVGSISVPRRFSLDDREPFWESERLDTAFFIASDEFVASGDCDFGDAEDDAKIATVVRARRLVRDTEDASLPYVVLGFPNVGHHVSHPAALEYFSFVPLTAYVTYMAEHSWDGHGERAPELKAELDIGSSSPELPAEMAHIAAEWRDRILSSVADGDRPPLGGFSGAPVFILHEHGESVLGVVKEGAAQFGARAVIAASCWDDVVGEFLRSNRLP